MDDTLVRAVKSNIKSVEESADHEAVRFSFFFSLFAVEICFRPSVCGFLVLKTPSGGCLFEGQISSKLVAFSFAQR